MSSLVYFLAEHYPWWGIPSILIMGETANHFRRTGQRARMLVCVLFALLFATLTVVYFLYDGLTNTRPAIQKLERSYTN